MSDISYEPGGPLPPELDIFEDDDGPYVLSEDGSRYEVEYADADADADADDDDEATPEEQAVFDTMLEANGGDFDAAVENYARWEAGMSEAHGVTSDGGDDEGYLTADAAEEWFRAHPAAAANPEDFLDHYNAAGEDLDAGWELYKRRLDADSAAAQRLNYNPSPDKPRDLGDAIQQSFDEGLIGGRKPYKHRSKAGDSSMDDAIGALQEELSAKNAVARQSEARVRKARRAG